MKFSAPKAPQTHMPESPKPVDPATTGWGKGSLLDEAAFVLFLGFVFALGTGFGIGVVFLFLHFTNCLRP